MRLNILPVVPVRWRDGSLVNRQGVVIITIKPHWERLDGIGAKLSFQDYTFDIKWPFLFMFQLHIVKYGVGDLLQEHVDMVSNGRLWRIQITFRKAKEGGELVCEHFVVNRPRFKIFEPGKHKHQVTEVKAGQRLILNFGIWIAWRPRWRHESQE